MRQRQRDKKGSFGAHFDELVRHFPRDAPADREPPRDARELQEKRDIHALLFERAWQVDNRERNDG